MGDTHEAVKRWESRGIGPFVIREHIELENARLFNQPGDFDHTSAFAQWGEVMVELIHQHDPGEVPVVGTSGVHHVAIFVDDFAEAHAEWTAAGFEEALYAEAGEMPFAFFDAREELGHFIEIYEETERLKEFYAHIAGLSPSGLKP